ncbi:pre-mRNA-processing protein 40C [Amborella trichopoda]|uniref:pre-mRNA-processing protein 40C n=1 Tax=Amborella trichopoda TaxID=13333 RepID=UPI0009BD3F86|nr:pre-mRNA-processing protein 40C [Amborella trichopoda]XP_020525340.1 pre-mRNA-processing protein 40C [Amborella trichopoda]|eukprot:XP_020525339.1 pre-mRNA-processing protein 40C [Amborella trichopoda]
MSSQAWLSPEVQPSAPGVPPQPLTPGQTTTGGPPGPSPPIPRPQNDQPQESVRAKFVASPGYILPAPSFSYGVVSQNNNAPRASLPPQSTPLSAVSVQPPVPGHSATSGASFSYSVASHATTTSATASNPMQGGKPAGPTSAASLQPPVPGQSSVSVHPNSWDPERPVQNALAQARPPFLVRKGPPSTSGFSFSGNSQSVSSEDSQKHQASNSDASAAVAQEAKTSQPSSSTAQTTPLPAPSSTTSRPVSSSPNTYATPFYMPKAPPFPGPPRLPVTPGTPGPPGIALSAPQLSSSVNIRPSVIDTNSAIMRPNIASSAPGTSNAASVPITQTAQPPIYSPYPTLPGVVPPPQAMWMHPSQMGGLQRPPFLPYPGTFPGPFPMPLRPITVPPVAMPDSSQPPGVSPIGPPGGIPLADHGAGIQVTISEEQSPPPGIDKEKDTIDYTNKDDNAVSNEDTDQWTAHKTDTGAVYYYNALTGESTYEKPPGFKGEPDKVILQRTPVSWEKLVGTDWALVATNDGKKYYYNTKSKISSWQVPPEVAELRKKQEADAALKANAPVQNAGISSDKGSVSSSLSAPAINTGGREAMTFKSATAPVSSSALDLIKKKLQDSGMPVTSSALPSSTPVPTTSDANGQRVVDTTVKGQQSENSKDKLKVAQEVGHVSDSSSDSEDVDSGPTKEECVIQFKEMLKEKGIAPFSKWEKELPKILFDPRFKAIPGYTERRSLFEHFVRTRAEEERKEKRAAQKAAIEGFKQLLEGASEDINHKTDYETFKKKWGYDPRFVALDRKEREMLLNERVLPLRKAVEEKTQAIRAAAVASFKSMLHEKVDINIGSRWSKVKDSLRNDPRYKSVKHEDREVLFLEYISELKAAEQEADRAAKAKREEEEKLKERERELRKRKEREEQEVERVRQKARRKDAVVSYQALLTERIKDPKASWTESKPKLEKDPLGRATNPELEPADMEKLFREHVKVLNERCAREFRSLLAEVITPEAAAQASEDGKTLLNSWSTAKKLLRPDPRYEKMPRRERESLWQRYAEDMDRRQRAASEQKEEKTNIDDPSRRPAGSSKSSPSVRRSHGRK